MLYENIKRHGRIGNWLIRSNVTFFLSTISSETIRRVSYFLPAGNLTTAKSPITVCNNEPDFMTFPWLPQSINADEECHNFYAGQVEHNNAGIACSKL